jgi:hypothetical protein
MQGVKAAALYPLLLCPKKPLDIATTYLPDIYIREQFAKLSFIKEGHRDTIIPIALVICAQ